VKEPPSSLEHLAACKSLEEVKISETRLTWDGLKHLKSLPNLKKLNLDETDISETDKAAVHENAHRTGRMNAATDDETIGCGCGIEHVRN